MQVSANMLSFSAIGARSRMGVCAGGDLGTGVHVWRFQISRRAPSCGAQRRERSPVVRWGNHTIFSLSIHWLGVLRGWSGGCVGGNITAPPPEDQTHSRRHAQKRGHVLPARYLRADVSVKPRQRIRVRGWNAHFHWCCLLCPTCTSATQLRDLLCASQSTWSMRRPTSS